jgi:1-acyl-sn-glycerol-3-phosphate acyltransferase
MTLLRLLVQRRFGAFFTVQALGALNDNVFRNALATLLVFGIGVEAGWDAAGLVNLAALLFILPYFLFSAIFGQLADRFEKSGMIRWIKLFELAICCFAGVALYLGNVVLLMSVVFLLGFQSTLFGPIKYAILPQLLDRERPDRRQRAGRSRHLHRHPGRHHPRPDPRRHGPGLALGRAGRHAGHRADRLAGGPGRSDGARRRCLAGPQPESDHRLVDHGPPARQQPQSHSYGPRRVVVLVLRHGLPGADPGLDPGRARRRRTRPGRTARLFIIGISTGALLCDKLSRGGIEIGLVPIGALGMTIFGLDLMFASPATPLVDATVADLLARDGSLRIIADLILIGISGGLFIVPLYALVQSQSGDDERARVIAGMNILNALFMVMASALAIVLLSVVGLSIPQLFGIVAVLNLAVGVYIVLLVPEFALRFLMWVISRLIYRVRIVGTGAQNIPAEGPALITSNHLSYMDPLIIGGTIQRPIRFVMTHRIYGIRGLTWLFKLAGAIPVAPAREDPELLKRAFDAVDEALARGELVGIFPEGGLSPDGEVRDFRSGITEILTRRPVPVIPMALEGLWGGVFSRAPGRWRRRDRGFFSRVQLKILDRVAPGEADRQARSKP